MTLYSEKKWKELFELAGFKDVKSWRVGKKNKWEGTLVVVGTKA